MNDEFDAEALLALLKKRGVHFVVIGGLAAAAYCSNYATDDLDICYARDSKNLKALSRVLIEIGARLRGAPSNIKFTPDERTLKNGLNFTLDTKFGKFDILGEVSGVGIYDDALKDSIEVPTEHQKVPILSLPKLIASKKAAGRPKDLILLVELEAIQKSKMGGTSEKLKSD